MRLQGKYTSSHKGGFRCSRGKELKIYYTAITRANEKIDHFNSKNGTKVSAPMGNDSYNFL